MTTPSPLRSLALLPVLAAGCSIAVEAAPPSSPEPTPVVVEAVGADWTRGDVEVTFDDRWTVRRCEGSAPLLCVLDGDRLLGDVELGRYPAGEDLLGAADLPAALRGHALDFLRTMEEDRAVACPEFGFQPMPTTDAVVGGEPAVRTGFVLRDRDGRQVERVIVHVAVRDATMWSVNASAYVEDGGCLPPEQDFSPAALEAFEPYLDALVRGTPLPDDEPEPTGQAEPLVDGVLDVTTVELLSGPEALAAARADGAVGPDEDLPNDVYLRDPGTRPVTVALAPAASVVLVDCSASCEPAGVGRDAFLTGEASPFNGDLAVYDVTITAGEVTALTEVYLP